MRAFPARDLIRGWLKAGVFEPGKGFAPTEEGTPQGGVISPLLLNVALHGLEEAAGVRYAFPGTGSGETNLRGPTYCPPMPQSPDDWERWWLGVTRQAIAADYLVHHGRPGPPHNDPTRLVHASCRRGLHARQGGTPAPTRAPSRLA